MDKIENGGNFIYEKNCFRFKRKRKESFNSC